MSREHQILVVGVGNVERGDDGVGLVVAGRLALAPPPGTIIRGLGGDVLAIVEDCGECEVMVCVDCSAGDGAPGRVRRFELARDEAPPRTLGAISSHGYGLTEAFALARALGIFPKRVVLYAVEGENFGFGRGLTPAVEQSASNLVERIRTEAPSLSCSADGLASCCAARASSGEHADGPDDTTPIARGAFDPIGPSDGCE